MDRAEPLDWHIGFRKDVAVLPDEPVGRKRFLAMKQASRRIDGQGPQTHSFGWRDLEKRPACSPSVGGRMHADIDRHRVHFHIGDCPMKGFVIRINPLDIHLVSSQCFLDAIFLRYKSGTVLLESINEKPCIIVGTIKDKMDMI